MRIIAGKVRGTKLGMVPGKHVRPTADRVKESLFQVLGPFFSGGRALDLFAGTGNLGLESLSRGVEQAVFVDSSFQSIETIKQNVAKTHFEEQSVIWKKDARRAIADCMQQGWMFDLIFVDPPYQMNLYLPVLTEIEKQGLCIPNGIVITEYAKNVSLPDQIGALSTWRDLRYGETQIKLYKLVDADRGQQN